MKKGSKISKLLFLLFIFLILISSCKNLSKKNPTTPTTSSTSSASTTSTNTTTSNTTTSVATTSSTSSTVSSTTSIVLSADSIVPFLDPVRAETNTSIKVKITINQNAAAISAFGLDLIFDPTVFSYIKTNKGDLTSNWAFIDGNEMTAGTIRIGGFVGSSQAISQGSKGTIFEVELKVTCSSCSNGHQSQLCIQAYVDDLKNMTPNPSCTIFTFLKWSIKVKLSSLAVMIFITGSIVVIPIENTESYALIQLTKTADLQCSASK